MEEIMEKLRDLDDHEFLELVQREVNRRFAIESYDVIGFDTNRSTDTTMVGLKLFMDRY